MHYYCINKRAHLGRCLATALALALGKYSLTGVVTLQFDFLLINLQIMSDHYAKLPKYSFALFYISPPTTFYAQRPIEKFRRGRGSEGGKADVVATGNQTKKR